MSDSHEHKDNLSKAIILAKKEKCEHILFAGDLGRPSAMVPILVWWDIPITMILGNNDAEIIGLMQQSARHSLFTLHKDHLAWNTYIDTLDWVCIAMHHYPIIANWAAESSKIDLAIAGHTHIFECIPYGDSLYINSGSILGDKEPAGFAIYDTETQTHKHILL